MWKRQRVSVKDIQPEKILLVIFGCKDGRGHGERNVGQPLEARKIRDFPLESLEITMPCKILIFYPQ